MVSWSNVAWSRCRRSERTAREVRACRGLCETSRCGVRQSKEKSPVSSQSEDSNSTERLADEAGEPSRFVGASGGRSTTRLAHCSW